MKEKLRIVIFTDVFLPSINGIVTSCLSLIEEWLLLGCDVCVVAPRHKKKIINPLPNLRIILLPSVPSLVYPDMRLGLLSKDLILSLKKFKPNLVHITSPGTVGLMGLMYAKFKKIKSVITFHTYFMEKEYLKTIGLGKTSVITTPFLWKLTKFIYDETDLILTPSNFVKKDLKKNKFRNTIKVIKNSVRFQNNKLDNLASKNFLEKYQLEKQKYFLYVGRISEEKNLDDLINIFYQLSTYNQKFKLLIVGYGPHLEELKKMVNRLALNQRVIFTNRIENNQLLSSGVYQHARCFVTCSHSEVQPMTLIESLFAKCPIIAYGSRGIGEMIDKAGIIIKPNNQKDFLIALKKIIADDNLYLNLQKYTKTQSLRYDSLKIAKKHLVVYQQLLNY